MTYLERIAKALHARGGTGRAAVMIGAGMSANALALDGSAAGPSNWSKLWKQSPAVSTQRSFLPRNTRKSHRGRNRHVASRAAQARREATVRAVQREAWQRDGGACVECGRREFLCFDHIVPF